MKIKQKEKPSFLKDLTQGVLLQTGTNYKIKFKKGPELLSRYAHENLQKLADEMSEAVFILFLVPVFGTDVPISACSLLYRSLSNRTFPAPQIVVVPNLIEGHLAAYQYKENKIYISEQLLRNAIDNINDRQKLFAALVEEYGHYIDDSLRNYFSRIGGDAKNDKGAIFAYNLTFPDLGDTPNLKFAHVDHEEFRGPMELDLTEAQNAIKKHSSKAAQQSDGKLDSWEFFGAGSGEKEHDQSWGHESIEFVLEDLGFDRVRDLPRIYFGNWLRDFSQVADAAIIRPAAEFLEKAQSCPQKYVCKPSAANDPTKLSRSALTKLVGVLAVKEFAGKDKNFARRINTLFSDDKKAMGLLGVYRPQEHIDNPLPNPAKSPEEWEDNSIVDPDFEKPPTTLQLGINPKTGLKNYIATPSESQSFPTAIEYMTDRLNKAAKAGYNDVGLRLFGEGLHVLEDYFSHSNFIEVSLIKLGFKNVFPWVDHPKDGSRIPIVTGMFGKTDVLGSLGPKLAKIIPHKIEDYKQIKPGERTPTDLAILIILEDLAQAQSADTRQKNNKYKGNLSPKYLLSKFKEYLALRDWVNSGKATLPVELFFKALHYSIQALLVVSNYGMYIGAETAGRLVDDAQTHFLEKEIGTNPTHSQLAKDHAHHHFHDIAAQLASRAVYQVGFAMQKAWNQLPEPFSQAKTYGQDIYDRSKWNPAGVAKSYIVHPLDTDWMDKQILDWANANPKSITKGESKSDIEHFHKEFSKNHNMVSEYITKWGSKILEGINQIKD